MVIPFYNESPEKVLRFGDVVRGYPCSTPVIKKPEIDGDFNRFRVEIEKPAFSVILSPSCSIRNKSVSLTPLVKVRGRFFDNPFLDKDLTAINREMEPENAIPPDAWKSFTDQERQARLAVGRAYSFPALFVYEKHDLLPKYEMSRKSGKITTNYYMIDFSSSYKLGCDEIIDPENSPIYSKCLQLSETTRLELLYKVVGYFNRVSREDAAGNEE